jgi:hypothetical protein
MGAALRRSRINVYGRRGAAGRLPFFMRIDVLGAEGLSPFTRGCAPASRYQLADTVSAAEAYEGYKHKRNERRHQ